MRMTINNYKTYLARKQRHKRWLEKCETESYECAIMRKIAQKEAVIDVRAKANRRRHKQWL